MGTWSFTMPLLSTLAALVIIVHSAEEEYEQAYRHDLRPRAYDTGTPSYEQPWRSVDVETMLQHSTKPDNWDDNSPEEPPRRRRPGRKRKRRPQPASEEILVPQERFVYQEESPRAYHEPNYSEALEHTEAPRRRRKNFDSRPGRWTEQPTEPERPLRRRGQRIKRPSLDSWPKLSEFSNYQPKNNPIPELEAAIDHEELNVDANAKQQAREHFIERDNVREVEPVQVSNVEIKTDVSQPDLEDPALPVPIDFEDSVQHTQMKEDKSLSEFSSEIMSKQRPNTGDREVNIKEKLRDKSPDIFHEQDKAQDGGPIDPLTLKEILKRSNGTSLSEILQQHNLSLSDLLHGRVNAISVLKSENPIEYQKTAQPPNLEPKLENSWSEVGTNNEKHVESDITGSAENIQHSEHKDEVTEVVTEPVVTTELVQKEETSFINSRNRMNLSTKVNNTSHENLETKEKNAPKITNKRRYLPGIRRKLRMRPSLNETVKKQLSRDLAPLNARRYLYFNNRTSNIKLRELKPTVPIVKAKNITQEIHKKEENDDSTTTTTPIPEDTTLQNFENYNPSTEQIEMVTSLSTKEKEIDEINTETTLDTTVTEGTTIEIVTTTTEKPVIIPATRPPMNTSSLRRQAFNNRLKKKRLKQKNSTTEPPQDDLMKNLFGMANLVSSSEFIARTQVPKSTRAQEPEDFFSTLENFITTEPASNIENETIEKHTTKVSTSTVAPLMTTTEETAKIEIEEIFNDMDTSARLSKILRERNMTLSELVEHRERGSSHVHLADIFHNASKEPNPPEPFLSKSLLEPISKETYPLRALLEANLHETTAKATTLDPPMTQENYLNIPVVMDFGNNVNENGENMGIMSLFNNYTNSDITQNTNTLQRDSEGTPYETTIIAVNTTKPHEPTRESRVLKNKPDMVSWNEIFALMGKTHHNETEDDSDVTTKEIPPSDSFKKITLDEDVDGDGVIVLEDLQHLKDFDSNIASASQENLEVNTYERTEPPSTGILDKIPSHTKSVTVATASIVGLAMVLFLLTYIAFKWKQQRKNFRKRSFGDERIPTPVFENRKGNKNNSSSRSISPMITTSNIYTLNTLDSQNGKDSPDYMWDSLRKPFQ